MNEWNVRNAEVIGSGHLLNSIPCQDKTYTLSENGITAVALADGAGSEPLSHEGAECAVETVCRLMCSNFDALMASPGPYDMKLAVIKTVSAAIKKRADILGVSPSNLSCTLLAVAVRGDDYLIFHIGDGVIGCRKAGNLVVASGPHNGEFANNTVFVTSPMAIRYANVMKGTQPELEGFIIMSDGSGHSLYRKKDGRLAGIIEKLFQRSELFAPEIAEIHLREILSEEIARRTSDDCSLALMTRRRGDLGNWSSMTPQKQAEILGVRCSAKAKRRRAIKRGMARYGIEGCAKNPKKVSVIA